MFVDESGPKDRRIKRLAVMDQDGANVRYLTEGNSLVLTPRFSPTSQSIAYMSYEGAEPSVYLLDVQTGQRRLIDRFPGMSLAPRFSPDGQRVVLSLERGGATNIFEYDLQTRGAPPAHRRRGHRCRRQLCAGRVADRLRIRPRRIEAALRDERRRLEPAAHHLRQRAATARRSGRRAAT